MRTPPLIYTVALLTALLIGTPTCWAGKKKESPKPVIQLTERGKQLEADYAAMKKGLEQEIKQAVPTVPASKIAAYKTAIEAEKATEAGVATAQKNLSQVGKGRGLVGHAKGKWIGGAKKGLAQTEEKLKKATTEEERQKLQKELVKWQKNLQDGLDALKERQKLLDDALAKEPEWTKQAEAAKQALANAKAATRNALMDLGLEPTLKSDALDAKLTKYIILSEATPRGLATFAQKGSDHETLIAALLSDTALMQQMMIADGAKNGNYGKAMSIYTAIQKASAKAKNGTLQRLALAISLELATPREQRNATNDTNAPKTVDPVKRYLSYEKAYLANELDPFFKDHSAWEMRMVVDGEEPDEIAAWGRDMLRNYRPDQITMDDYRWRYIAAVRTEIRYGSEDCKFDNPDQQFFQNILMNGGICGRRAFYGRFILRAFGVPTTARPQRGHAALVHWTPAGWVACLGGGWGSGWTKTRYDRDTDFLATTQAREVADQYLMVKRAQWIGRALGEKPAYGLLGKTEPGFWHGVSLYRQRKIIEDAKAVALAAVGEDLGEANESKVKEKVIAVVIKKEDQKISVSPDGTITIPAAACSTPQNNTGKIKFMASNLGGMQLHYERTGKDEAFVYELNAPKAGNYRLTARVVTPSWKQHLYVSANTAKEPVDIALPYTVGMWDKTAPVEVTLVKGNNVLTFTRAHAGLKGVTIRDFTLTPVK